MRQQSELFSLFLVFKETSHGIGSRQPFSFVLFYFNKKRKRRASSGAGACTTTREFVLLGGRKNMASLVFTCLSLSLLLFYIFPIALLMYIQRSDLSLGAPCLLHCYSRDILSTDHRRRRPSSIFLNITTPKIAARSLSLLVQSTASSLSTLK